MEPGAPLVLRDARPEERPRLIDLTLRAYAEYAEIMSPGAWMGLREAIAAALDDPGPADRIVASKAGTVVGSVLLYPPGTVDYQGAIDPMPWPEVRLLAVEPAARGGGVARALMMACLRRARAIGARRIGIHTSASMVAARRLYDEMGFQPAPEFDFQPSGGERVEAFTLDL